MKGVVSLFLFLSLLLGKNDMTANSQFTSTIATNAVCHPILKTISYNELRMCKHGHWLNTYSSPRLKMVCSCLLLTGAYKSAQGMPGC